MKVVSLLEQVARYAGRMELHIVPFTHIQEEIQRSCPEELFTLIMRRFMMRLAASIAKTEQCGALITGESVGQVASQTIPALACTDAVADMPVFRPVIGMDKDEIIAIAAVSTPLIYRSSPTRTAARCSPPAIPAPGPSWPWWRKRKRR